MWLVREQKLEIDKQLSKVIELLLLEKHIDAELLTRALNKASIELSECIEAVRGEME